jgi:hypothetical protein
MQHEHLAVLFQTAAGILENSDVTYWADFGTLLGCKRGNDLIWRDTDVDLAILASDRPKMLKLKPTFVAEGIAFEFRDCGPACGGKIRLRDSLGFYGDIDMFTFSSSAAAGVYITREELNSQGFNPDAIRPEKVKPSEGYAKHFRGFALDPTTEFIGLDSLDEYTPSKDAEEQAKALPMKEHSPWFTGSRPAPSNSILYCLTMGTNEGNARDTVPSEWVFGDQVAAFASASGGDHTQRSRMTCAPEKITITTPEKSPELLVYRYGEDWHVQHPYSKGVDSQIIDLWKAAFPMVADLAYAIKIAVRAYETGGWHSEVLPLMNVFVIFVIMLIWAVMHCSGTNVPLCIRLTKLW